MNRIVVTGATGFIGHHLVRTLAENQNNYVYAILRPCSKNRDVFLNSKNIEITECTLENITQLPELVSESIDVFYHLAWAGIRGNQRNERKLQNLNYQYSIDTINTAGIMESKIYIGLGSQAEYGYCDGEITETTPTIPTTEYGIAKLKTCINGKIVAKRYTNMKYIWPRLFSAYGPGDFKGSMIMSVLQNMLQNKDIIMTTACTQLWDYLYISDLISMLIELQKVPEGIYNLASGETRMLKEYVYEMAKITGFNRNIIFGTEKTESIRPSINKLMNLGVKKPRISFGAGIRQTLATMNTYK